MSFDFKRDWWVVLALVVVIVLFLRKPSVAVPVDTFEGVPAGQAVPVEEEVPVQISSTSSDTVLTPEVVAEEVVCDAQSLLAEADIQSVKDTCSYLGGEYTINSQELSCKGFTLPGVCSLEDVKAIGVNCAASGMVWSCSSILPAEVSCTC